MLRSTLSANRRNLGAIFECHVHVPKSHVILLRVIDHLHLKTYSHVRPETHTLLGDSLSMDWMKVALRSSGRSSREVDDEHDHRAENEV